MAPKNNCNSHLNGRVRREISRRIILEQDRKDNEEWFHHHRAWNSDLNRRVRRDVEFRRNLEAKEKIVREQNIDENAEEPNAHLNGRVHREISRGNILEQDQKDNEEWFRHH